MAYLDKQNYLTANPNFKNRVQSILTDVAQDITTEQQPIPPLKVYLSAEFGKSELKLDFQDDNYLLKKARHSKRQNWAKNVILGDTNSINQAYNIIVAEQAINTLDDTQASDTSIRNWILGYLLLFPGVTNAEELAAIPSDETL